MSPSQNDILLGKGGNIFRHSGNNKLREQCRRLAPSYDKSDRKMKAKIIEDLLAKIRMTSRFLKKVENAKPTLWIDADYKTAREKVSQTLRDSVTESKFGSTKRYRKLRVRKEKNTSLRRKSSYHFIDSRVSHCIHNLEVGANEENNPWDNQQRTSLTNYPTPPAGTDESFSTPIMASEHVPVHQYSYGENWCIENNTTSKKELIQKIDEHSGATQHKNALEAGKRQKKDLWEQQRTANYLTYSPTSIVLPDQFSSKPIVQIIDYDPIDIFSGEFDFVEKGGIDEMQLFFEEVEF